MMTRAEFIAGYVERSGLRKEATILGDGFIVAGRKFLALPCACGEDVCQGWAKVSNTAEDIEDHMRLYAPPTAETAI
jgi:hypothetical protein